MPIRPPFAIAENRFLSLCRDCSACLSACPSKIIVKDRSGRPILNFAKAECSFCMDCEVACPSGALNSAKARSWDFIAHVSTQCLSMNDIVCRSCGDICETDAIAFKLQLKGRSSPVIDAGKCTGCGHCVSICPNNSIEIVDPSRSVKEMQA